MRKFITYISALAALSTLIACNKEGSTPVEPVEKIDVSVTIKSDVVTRTSNLMASDREKAYRDAYVLVYDEKGELVDYREWKGDVLTFSLIGGQYTFVGALNCGRSVLKKTSLTDLRNGVATLEGDLEYFVMLGSGQAVVSRDVEMTEVVIDVKRMAAKVILEKVTRRMSSSVLAQKPFLIESFYMTNVPGDGIYEEALNQGSKMSVNRWYNRGGYEESDCDPYLYKAIHGLNIPQGESHRFHTDADSVVFYVYPNSLRDDSRVRPWYPRKTRFILQASVNGRTMYYPVTFDRGTFDGFGTSGIKANHVYTIRNITITNEGVDDPEKEWEKGIDGTVDIEVTDWDNGGEYDVIM